MKKTYFFKPFLVAFTLLLVGVNGAWGQSVLYEKGTTGNDWATSDLNDWVVDSDHGTTAKSDASGSVTNVTSSIESNKLKFNSFGYNNKTGQTEYATTAAKSYSFTKSLTTNNNSVLKLTAEWAGGNATGNNSKTHHQFTFGDIVFSLYGQSGGAFLKIGSADAIEIIAQGNNVGTHRNSVWNIELTVNQSTNDVEYSLSTSTLNSGTAVTGTGTTAAAGSYNGVTIGLANNGLPNWSLFQTLNSIKITEATAPDFTLSENTKSVAVGSAETVSVMGITGTINVSSDNTAIATASYNDGVITINGIANGITNIVVTGTNDGLEIEKTIEVTVGTVATTDITINYLYGSTPIATQKVLNGKAIGSTLTASDITYDAEIIGTDCRYVDPSLSVSLPYTVVADGVINVTYATKQDAVASVDIYAKIGGDKHKLKTITTDGKYVGDQAAITYPRFYLDDTTLYSTAKEQFGTGNYYGGNFTITGSDLDIIYSTVQATNVVYFKEGEDIEGMISDATNNANIRCSEGKGGRTDSEITLTSLAPRKYNMFTTVWGGTGSTFTFKADGDSIVTISTTGALSDANNQFVINGSSDASITVSGTNSTGKIIDLVYIQELNYLDEIANGDFAMKPWNVGWTGTTNTQSDKKQIFTYQTSDSNYFAEMWAGNSTTFTAEGNIYQTLYDVPAGTYILSADVMSTATQGSALLYAKVGDNSDVTVAAGNDEATKSVAFTVETESDVIVGFKTSGITGGTGWIKVDNFTLTPAEPATIGTTGYATFSSTHQLDLDNITAEGTGEMKAYIAPTANTTAVTLSEATGKIPAGTGLLLIGDADNYVIPVATTSTAVGTNYLAAGTGTNVSSGYVLVNRGGVAKFAPFTTSVTIPVGKAYLNLAPESRELDINFDDDISTGIRNIREAMNSDSAIYNISGQRLSEPRKGLNIQNGKKFVMTR